MAKRELIERENLINELIESSKHHAQTSREESLLHRDRQIVREQPTITEQDIVKPYLERLKRRMEARDDDNGGEPLNAVDRGYHLAYEHLCEEIDNLLSESDWNASYKGGTT